MTEEQACLVRPRSDSEGSAKVCKFGAITKQNMAYTEGRFTGTESSGEPNMSQPDSNINHTDNTNDSNELIDYNETNVLSQFHEDALRQSGCGISQVRVIVSCSLCIAAASVELVAIPFVLPSAEIELCIQPHEKSWLVMISLLGLSVGAVGYGALSRAARRRALLSALALNLLFALVAAFMPTYGTAMCARFFSAIGSGGIVPIAYSYAAESVSRKHRHGSLTPLLLAVGVGGLYASMLASAILPHTTSHTLQDNRLHFSAWHRYLLLCTLPIVFALISMFWTQESPRYLLEVGRDVDAMMLYQNMHTSNKKKICGGGVCSVNADYRLAELHLPSKRVPQEQGVKMFWKTFFQIFSSSYRQSFFTLTGTLLFAMSIQFYLAAYTPTVVNKLNNDYFEANKQYISNTTFENEFYNKTLKNTDYVNCTFVKCTFRDMVMSHVTFVNCSFQEVSFANIKTSYTTFKGSLFVKSTIIDTDISARRDLDPWCVLNDSSIRGMEGGCRVALSPPSPTTREHATSIAQILAAPAIVTPIRFRQPAILSALCVLLSPMIYIVQTEMALAILEAVYRFFITLIFFGASVMVVETFPVHLRCTAHGLVMSCVYIGAIIARSIGEMGPNQLISSLLVAFLSLITAAISFKLKPSHTHLL